MGFEKLRLFTAAAAVGLAATGCNADTGTAQAPAMSDKAIVSFNSFSPGENMTRLVTELTRYGKGCTVIFARMVEQEHGLSNLEITTAEQDCKPGNPEPVTGTPVGDGGIVYQVGPRIFVIAKQNGELDRTTAAGKVYIEEKTGDQVIRKEPISFSPGVTRGQIVFTAPR